MLGMPDYRRSLSDLNDTWSDCTRCELGIQREAMRGEFVFGEGKPGGVLFVGEGPGIEEERSGRPFVGPSGLLLRATLAKKAHLSHCYFINVVACRSCAQVYDGEGQPMFRKHGKKVVPLMRDQPPTKVQMEACADRFWEQVYLIDPILIVALGVTAAEFLLKRAVAITKERGNFETIQVPGIWTTPVLTEKRGIWVRKQAGQLVFPVERNMVDYLVLLSQHPAFVKRREEDRSPGNPLLRFVEDMRLAAKIYAKYQEQVHGRHIPEINDAIEDVNDDLEDLRGGPPDEE